MKFPLVCFLGMAIVASAVAEVSFSGLNLDTQSRLIFSATDESAAPARVWFRADLARGIPPFPLTFPPSSAEYLPTPDLLQIHNRFGVWRLDLKSRTFTNVASRVFGRDPGEGEGLLLPTLFSPDGTLALSWGTQTAVDGTLQLRDLISGQNQNLSDKVGLSYEKVPALWSPDSQFFIYEKQGNLYYYSIRQWRENRVPDEALRWLGPGLLSAVSWNPSGDLIYVNGRLVYRILPEEFFTRSLYRAQFQTWGIEGELPLEFDAARDRFWPSPDGRTVLVDFSGRLMLLYPLNTAEYSSSVPLSPMTYLPLPQNLDLKRVVWTQDNRITILARSLQKGKDVSQVLRLSSSDVQTVDLGRQPILDLRLSPDETHWLVVRRDSVSICDGQTFQILKSIPVAGLVAGFWRDNSTVLLTGTRLTALLDWNLGRWTWLAQGQMDTVGVDSSGTLVGNVGSQWYYGRYVGGSTTVEWQPSDHPLSLAPVSSSSSLFRVFVSPLESGAYHNLIYVRDLAGLKTQPLFQPPSITYEPLPLREDLAADPSGDGRSAPFLHGSRVRVREVALAIDALDSADGLPQVLRDLALWGFHATFFVNGEFLRRHPQAAQELAQSGQEVANMFHLPLDLTTKEFTIDSDFIRQGLARQEDNWFQLTGKELSLLWHAPFWKTSPEIQAGGSAANYVQIGTDLESLRPKTTKIDVSGTILSYLKVKRPGSILPLTLGWKDSRTGESFYTRWDLLLDGLAKSGYRVVSVSQLLDHSRP